MENSNVNAEAPAAGADGGDEVKLSPSIKKYKIGGCDVCFPHKAYGTQMGFMSKVISSLENSQNALLEAPTGSGKTLSLLCSALAWQEKEKRRFASLESTAATFGIKMDATVKAEARCGDSGGALTSTDAMTPTRNPPSTNPTTAATTSTEPSRGNTQVAGGFMPGATEKESEAHAGPPRVYYATRTHSQIQQVVAELKRCGYKPKMAILGSKQHYCVNSFVRNKPSIEEACEESLKASSCKFFSGSIARFTSTHTQLHDVEDLCRMGKQRGACPFFVSKELAKDADIVFGPYNYFIDPVIRRSMSIEMDNAVFIFDEAHNIEDVCRESGSLEVSLEVVNDMVAALTRACKHNMRPEVYDPLLALVTTMKNWIMREDAILKQKNESRGGRGRPGGRSGRGQGSWDDSEPQIWQGKQLLQHLSFMGLGADRIETLWNCYEKAREHDEQMMQEERKNGGRGDVVGGAGEGNGNQGDGQTSQIKSGRIGAMTLGTLSRIIQLVGILHHQCEDGGRDYRLVLTRTMDQSRGAMRRRQAPKEIGGLVVVTVSVWCLNPGIIFRPIATKSHSVVLTSGTLSPLDSFSTELGAKFPVSLEAPHVVNMQKQVLAGVLSTAPNGMPLKATYQQSGRPEFMDGVGEIILSMCSTVPDGLLVFFSSYSMMDKLTVRWKETGIYEVMTRLKPHVEEPRTGGGEALKKTMNQYYKGISNGDGGLFFAVCRGKVSEGLDFSDQNARGVVIVGIPYPNLKDAKVNAKKDYNNSRASSSEGIQSHLLSGDRWYEQQAFRALNQALGRCIRHKNDYGTIILVDERFKATSRQSGLSRWMRSNLNIFPSPSLCMSTMEDFFKRLSLDPELNPKRSNRHKQPGTDTSNRKDALAILMGGRLGKKAKTRAGIGGTGSDEAEAEVDDANAMDAFASVQPGQVPSPSQNSRKTLAIEDAIRDVPFAEWVRREVEAWTNLVLPKVDSRANAIERAMDGLNHVFNASAVLDFCWTDRLAVPIPYGIQAVFCELLTSKHGVNSHVLDVAALNYGKERKWDDLDQHLLLQAIKQRYNECMDDVRHEMLKSSQQSIVSLSTPLAAPKGSTGPPHTGPTPGARPNLSDEIKFLAGISDDEDDW